jgi:D-aminopeptidase
VIAFSTKNLVDHAPSKPVRQVERLENDSMSPLFLATVESVEEAVYNSLLKATTVKGFQSHSVESIPVDRLKEIFAARSSRK